jgi:hypothetical protein
MGVGVERLDDASSFSVSGHQFGPDSSILNRNFALLF